QPTGRRPEVSGAAKTSRFETYLPSGWDTLYAEEDRLVAGTRPLSERDLRLALLAHDDAAFSAFPSDGVVFVVGGDRLTPKYSLGEVGRTSANGTEVIQGALVGTPGPANGLGVERVLPGGVRVRRGDGPRVTVPLAAY